MIWNWELKPMNLKIVILAVLTLTLDPGSLYAGCSGTGSGSGMSGSSLTCRGSCDGSECIVREMENPPGTFYKTCSCSSSSESDCCHLILKLTGSGGQNNGWDTGGDCPSCGTTGFCTVQTQGESTQAVCVQAGPS